MQFIFINYYSGLVLVLLRVQYRFIRSHLNILYFNDLYILYVKKNIAIIIHIYQYNCFIRSRLLYIRSIINKFVFSYSLNTYLWFNNQAAVTVYILFSIFSKFNFIECY